MDRLEVEMKFPVGDLDVPARRLAERGGRTGPVVEEADAYYNAPDRDFARSDEALRIRRAGVRNVLTYKGPKLDAQTKTRAELEVRLADGPEPAEQLGRILELLGYKLVAMVRKRRRKLWLSDQGFEVEVSLDQVEQLGAFAELEIQASPDQLDRARSAVQQLAADLGLAGSERRSYLELLLTR